MSQSSSMRMAPPALSSTMTTSSSFCAVDAVFAFLTVAISSGPSGCGRFAGTTSATPSLCCLLPFVVPWPLASGAGVFLGLVGILISPEEAPLTGLSSRGSLLWAGQQDGYEQTEKEGEIIRFLDGDHHVDVRILVVFICDGQERIRLDACTIVLDGANTMSLEMPNVPRSLSFLSRLSVSSGSYRMPTSLAIEISFSP